MKTNRSPICICSGERTSIRIPLQNLREAASIVTDMDSFLTNDGRDHASDLRIEEKIKRERAIQEKSGWLDCTEVFSF